MIKTLKVKNYKSLRDVKINFGYKKNIRRKRINVVGYIGL